MAWGSPPVLEGRDRGFQRFARFRFGSETFAIANARQSFSIINRGYARGFGRCALVQVMLVEPAAVVVCL